MDRKLLPIVVLTSLVTLSGHAAEPSSPTAKPFGQPPSVLSSLNALSTAERAAGWKLLFDGKTTDGWRNYKKQTVSTGWRVIDGALCRVDQSAGDLITIREFDNFILELDYKVPPLSNSGVLYRVQEDRQRAALSGVEYQILDNANPKGDVHKAGWIYGLYEPPPDPRTGKPLDATKPAGEWNHVKIVCDGPHVEHWMNGVKYCEGEIGGEDWLRRVAKSKFARLSKFGQNVRGHVALQGDHGNVCFANIKLLALPAK